MPATARPTQEHSHAGGQAGAKPKLYNPRHPERTLLYQTIAEHFETWFELASAGQFDGRGDHHTPKHGGGMTSRGPARGDRPFRFEVLVSNTQLFDWGNLTA
jgi:hypothetical protein